MAKKKVQTLAEQIEALETIVTQVESSDMGIDDSIKALEEGIRLSKEIKSALQTIEHRIEELEEKEEGM